jgi:hypothetical protein
MTTPGYKNNPFDDSFDTRPVAVTSSSKNPFDNDNVGRRSPRPQHQQSTNRNRAINNPFEATTTTATPNNNITKGSDFLVGISTGGTTTVDDDEEEEEPFDIGDENITPVGAPVEASWQYLGDLPYRRVPVYTNVRWGGNAVSTSTSMGPSGGPSASVTASTFSHSDDMNKRTSSSSSDVLNYGLSAFPKTALQRHPDMLNPRELRELLNASTVTKVVGCQYGGPIAAVTLPIAGEASWFNQTDIRILTNSGTQLAAIEFPLRDMERKYSPSDIMEIGFTDRTALVVVLKDSLCLVYDLTGDLLLPPFHILPRGDGQGTELYQACVFEGGAVRCPRNNFS